MNRRLAGLVLLLALGSQAAAQSITDEVDRFTGERQIAYTSDGNKGNLRLPVFTLKGQLADKDEGFVVQMVFVGSVDRRMGSWRFLSCHNVDWIVDGRPLQAGPVVHRGQVIRGGVLESITQQIDPAAIAAIGSASVVEYRVCRDEFRLSPTDIAAFRQVGAKIGEGAMPHAKPAVTPSLPPAQPSEACASCGNIGKGF